MATYRIIKKNDYLMHDDTSYFVQKKCWLGWMSLHHMPRSLSFAQSTLNDILANENKPEQKYIEVISTKKDPC